MPELTLAQQVARKLDATDIVALTLWGEARHEATEGIVAVGNVIANRVRDRERRWGPTWQDVCLKKWQFSCWIPQGGAANYARVKAQAEALMGTRAIPQMKEPRLRECWWVARGIVDQMFRDNTKGANHYHTLTLTPLPKWAKRDAVTCVIGAHIFYRL